jgi:hypothetical protein
MSVNVYQTARSREFVLSSLKPLISRNFVFISKNIEIVKESNFSAQGTCSSFSIACIRVLLKGRMMQKGTSPHKRTQSEKWPSCCVLNELSISFSLKRLVDSVPSDQFPPLYARIFIFYNGNEEALSGM